MGSFINNDASSVEDDAFVVKSSETAATTEGMYSILPLFCFGGSIFSRKPN